MIRMYWLLVITVAAVGRAGAQLTAQSSVAPDLRECYTNGTLLDRNNLPPTTMPVLIDILRKIEDTPDVNVDLRQLAVLLLHTFRQDGIEYHRQETSMAVSSNILPYAPTFHSFYRHKLLLTRVIPNSQQSSLNNTVNGQLKCALHHMLSTTVDSRLRGDENSCNMLAQYRALRTVRDLRQRLMKNDVEVLDVGLLNTADKNGQMRQFNPKDDVEYTNMHGSRYEKQLLGESQCPLLDGVVHTRWGAVSAGNVIAGIAAGAQLQSVPVLELAKGAVINYENVQRFVTSIYPATLSGDIAEAVLIQGTGGGNSGVTIGAAGNWNSTQAPRYFMLHSRTNIEMTDPEIRGDIDGFVLGSLLTSAMQNSNNMKLSQLLDMYYSARNGVLNPSVRACNRRQLNQQYVTNTNLVNEAYAFAAALDTNIPLPGTIMRGLDELVNNAVSNFQSYTSSNLNDMTCFNTETSTSDFRARTNLYLVIDAAWQYQAIYPAISYLLDNIEVSKFGSSVTLMNAIDASIVINKTFSLADFHSEYTLAKHQSISGGINLENTLTNIRIMMQSELENEKVANYVGGNSTVLLFLISGNIQSNQNVYEQAKLLNETVPDLRVLFATATNQFDSLWMLVRDIHNDIKTITLTTDGRNVDVAMNPVLDRITQVGRRIINSNCGSTFASESVSGTRQFDDYLEPGYINYYSISPNYFYGNNDNRKVRISRSMAGVGSLTICHSRVTPQPRQNSSNVIINDGDSNEVTCQTIATTGNVEISLQNACDGYWTVGSCPLFHISVQSNVANSTTSYNSICAENACRFPYNMRYQIQIEEFGCFSNARTISASLTLIMTSFFIIFRP